MISIEQGFISDGCLRTQHFKLKKPVYDKLGYYDESNWKSICLVALFDFTQN